MHLELKSSSFKIGWSDSLTPQNGSKSKWGNLWFKRNCVLFTEISVINIRKKLQHSFLETFLCQYRLFFMENIQTALDPPPYFLERKNCRFWHRQIYPQYIGIFALSDFHCICVSGPLQSIPGPRDAIYFLNALTTGFINLGGWLGGLCPIQKLRSSTYISEMQ